MSMVTVDQSMSGGGDIDYADFATQMVDVRFTSEDQLGSPAGTATIEPLRGRGGLANNEVAELLYLETEYDLTMLAGPDQDVGQATDALGVVGINLPEDVRDALVRNSSAQIDTNPETDTRAFGNSLTDNAYLQQLRTVSGLAFDDEDSSGGGGPGGTFNNDAFHAEKYFRETHGRGPVVDQTDDISVATLVTSRDAVVDVTASFKLTMYWDVAETSDAGRRFSVP